MLDRTVTRNNNMDTKVLVTFEITDYSEHSTPGVHIPPDSIFQFNLQSLDLLPFRPFSNVTSHHLIGPRSGVSHNVARLF